MSDAGAVPSRPVGRFGLAAPLLLFIGSVALYAGVALWTGETRMLDPEGVIGLLQRMVALGIVAIGQTFAILAGSIDLSVANLISVGAVLASYVMQGRPEMMLPAVVLVLAVSAAIGLLNGALIAWFQVNAFIATLGVGLILQGLLSASFTNFAGSVPKAFQALAYGGYGGAPFSVIGLFALAALASVVLSATKFGAHLYAVGGNVEGARLAGIRTDLVTIGAHVACSLTAGVTGLYLASRLRSGAPWVGRDGVYDLEFDRGRRHRRDAACRRPGRSLGHARRRPVVCVARRGLQHARRVRLSETRAARRDRGRRCRRLHRAVAGPRRMTVALDDAKPASRAGAFVRQINLAVVVLVVFYGLVGAIQPSYLEPAGAMNFLRRAAPLAILASGQVFVLVSGGFDLSVGSIVTITVIGGSMLTANDPSKTWWAIGVLYAIGLVVGLINGAIVAYLKTPSFIATLGALLSVNGAAMMWCGGAPRGYLPDNFRMFGRFMFHDVPVIKVFPLAVLVLAAVTALAWWGLHGTVFGRRVFAVGDNPRAAQFAGVKVEYVRLGVFVISALSAVTAGVMLGGFGGVSVDVGLGLELQAIAACVVGGVQLMGGRGTVVGAVAGALTLTALFTLLTLLGLPQPLKETAQGLILIAAVAFGAWRRRRVG